MKTRSHIAVKSATRRRPDLATQLLLTASLGLLIIAPAVAQGGNGYGGLLGPADNGPDFPPNNPPANPPSNPPDAQYADNNGPGGGDSANSNAQAGPVRMARFSFLSGDVTWRDGADGSWSPAAQNFPLRQGAQIWVSDSSRAEIQFDDGSRLRLDQNTLITLQTLYSDTQGEFTEITLNDGQLTLRLNNQYSQYQVNTSIASMKAVGPARVRVGSGEGAQFGVTVGQATVGGNNGEVNLAEGGYLDVVDGNTPYTVGTMPAEDDWDRWNDDRDHALDAPSQSAQYCPPNIALVADDLDTYGDWHDDPQYGHVWCPRNTPAGWRPYSDGRWVWVAPFGWTWVGNEAWGWAPYHYGTWISRGYGWAWVPGPSVQYWSPGVVSFYQNDNAVAWCPLAPREVHYPPTMAIGFRGGNWSLFFSIGGAACYYPTQGNYCEARPFSTREVNRVTYVTNTTNIYNTTIVRDVTVNQINFVPANARHSGGTQVSIQGFGGRGGYQPIAANNAAFFRTASVVTAPPGRGLAAFGPPAVRVTRASFTPTHSFVPPTHVPPPTIVHQTLFRAPLPSRVPVAPAAPSQHFVTAPLQNFRNLGAPGAGGSSTPNGGTNRPNGYFGNGNYGNRNAGGTTGNTAPPTAGSPANGSNTGTPARTGPANVSGGPATGTRPGGFGQPTNGTRTGGTGTYRSLHSRTRTVDPKTQNGDNGKPSANGNNGGGNGANGGGSGDHRP